MAGVGFVSAINTSSTDNIYLKFLHSSHIYYKYIYLLSAHNFVRPSRLLTIVSVGSTTSEAVVSLYLGSHCGINKPKTTPSAESALVQTSGTAIYYGGHNSGINVQVISQGSISDSHYQDSESRFLMLSV